jgi:hypothetical protein
MLGAAADDGLLPEALIYFNDINFRKADILAIVSLRKLQLPLDRSEARLPAQWIHERIGLQFHQLAITQSHRGVEPLESFRATYIKRRTTNVKIALTS